MSFTIEPYQLQQMLCAAAEMGAKKALERAGLDKTQVSRSEAYRRFSKYRVDTWIKQGKVNTVKDKGLTLINLSELEAVSQTENIISKY